MEVASTRKAIMALLFNEILHSLIKKKRYLINYLADKCSDELFASDSDLWQMPYV